MESGVRRSLLAKFNQQIKFNQNQIEEEVAFGDVFNALRMI